MNKNEASAYTISAGVCMYLATAEIYIFPKSKKLILPQMFLEEALVFSGLVLTVLQEHGITALV